MEAALDLAKRMLKKAKADGRILRVVELLVLQSLVYQGKKDISAAEYAHKLLEAFGPIYGLAPVPDQLLIEPLSAREIEVLKLIETGLSNQEIADRLYLSVATVKRHISNIYAKLDVETRTQALSRGKELGAFDR